MRLADLIRQMAEAGAPPAAIAIAVEAIEIANEKDAERRQKQAERKRRSRDSHGTVTGHGCDSHAPSPSPSPPSSFSPTPPHITTPSSPPTKPEVRARATRLPEGWTPSDADIAFAESQLTIGQAATELHKFRDFWRAKAGKDATKHDWSATWRNWIRRAVEQQPRGSPANGKPLTFREQQRQQHRDLLAELDQSIERDRQGGDPPNLRLLPGNGRG